MTGVRSFALLHGHKDQQRESTAAVSFSAFRCVSTVPVACFSAFRSLTNACCGRRECLHLLRRAGDPIARLASRVHLLRVHLRPPRRGLGGGRCLGRPLLRFDLRLPTDRRAVACSDRQSHHRLHISVPTACRLPSHAHGPDRPTDRVRDLDPHPRLAGRPGCIGRPQPEILRHWSPRDLPSSGKTVASRRRACVRSADGVSKNRV